MIRVVRVSGTIRKAEEEAVRRARKEIVRAKLLEQEGGDGSSLENLLRGGQDATNDLHDEEAGIEDMSDGAEEMEDDSG